VKLTNSQRSALQKLAAEGPQNYNGMCKAGTAYGRVNGKTLDWLTTRGLATSTAKAPRMWEITEHGLDALKADSSD
jgi:hypothetical protein